MANLPTTCCPCHFPQDWMTAPCPSLWAVSTQSWAAPAALPLLARGGVQPSPPYFLHPTGRNDQNCRGHASADRQSPPWTNFLLPASLTSVFQEPGTENKMRAHAPPSDRRNRAGRRKGTPLPNTRSARPRGNQPLPGRLTPQRPAQLPARPGARVWQALSQPRLSGVGVFPGRTPGCCRVVPWGTGVPTPSRPWRSSLTPLQTPGVHPGQGLCPVHFEISESSPVLGSWETLGGS